MGDGNRDWRELLGRCSGMPANVDGSSQPPNSKFGVAHDRENFARLCKQRGIGCALAGDADGGSMVDYGVSMSNRKPLT
jgi:hypothetical protein